jgi:hypothetical protein
VKREKLYEFIRWPKSVKERSKRIRVRQSTLANIPEDVWLYRVKTAYLPGPETTFRDSMGREGAETVTELADLRWQRDALMKRVEELQRELEKERRRAA